MLYKYNPKSDFKFSSVNITSPEQFVPLFLAYESPLVYNIYSEPYNVPIDNLHETDNPEYDKLTRSELKQMLMDQLNYSYPDEYFLYFSIDTIHRTARPPFSSGSLSTIFHQHLEYDYIAQTGWFAKPGLVSQFTDSRVNTWASERFPTSCFIANLITDIRPTILMLVKAKHIPMLRAMQLLGSASKELPLTDMRLLSVCNPTNTEQLVVKNIFMTGGFDKFVKEQGLIRQFVTYEEMNSYLIGPSTNLSTAEFAAQLEYISD